MIYDDIKLYLPKYLSDKSMEELLENLKNFPKNITSITTPDLEKKSFPDGIKNSFYSSSFQEKDVIYQGDGIKDLLVTNLPEEKIGKAPVIILSNTCDVAQNNPRVFFPAQITYATIFKLDKYKNKLLEAKTRDEQSIKNHIDSIKKQSITQILYLPIGSGLDYEGIVFLDRINHCDNQSVDRKGIENKRLFSLSNYGFYLLLLKISIHFTRMQEKVDRGNA